MPETIDHPAHYGSGTYEAIAVIENWGLGFRLGNALKYLCRAGKKGSAVEDLRKARWYLDREIAVLEREAERQLACDGCGLTKEQEPTVQWRKGSERDDNKVLCLDCHLLLELGLRAAVRGQTR